MRRASPVAAACVARRLATAAAVMPAWTTAARAASSSAPPPPPPLRSSGHVPKASQYTAASDKPRASDVSPDESSPAHEAASQTGHVPGSSPRVVSANSGEVPRGEGEQHTAGGSDGTGAHRAQGTDAHYFSSAPAWATDSLHSTRRFWRTIETWQRGVLTGVGAFMGVGGLTYLLWDLFSSDAAEQTKVVASDVLRDREVRDQAFIATKGLVQSVLRDDDAVELLVDVVKRLLAQDGSRQSVSLFLKSIFEDTYTQEVTKHFVLEIVHDEWVREQLLKVARDLTLDLLADEGTKQAMTDFLVQTSSDALRDENLHRTGGDAIKGTVIRTITPSWFMGGGGGGSKADAAKDAKDSGKDGGAAAKKGADAGGKDAAAKQKQQLQTPSPADEAKPAAPTSATASPSEAAPSPGSDSFPKGAVDPGAAPEPPKGAIAAAVPVVAVGSELPLPGHRATTPDAVAAGSVAVPSAADALTPPKTPPQ